MSNEECLKPEALERVVAGTAAAGEKEHAARCAQCATEVEMLRSFLAAEPTPEEAAMVRQVEQRLRSGPVWRDGERRRGWAWRPLWGMGLAGLAAALTLGVWLRGPAERPADPAYDTVRSGRVDGIEPAGDVKSVPAVLRWAPVAGASRYEMRLLDVEEQTLWRGESTGHELALPPEAQALMTARKTLIWRVTAFDAAGVRIGTGTGRFRVTNE